LKVRFNPFFSVMSEINRLKRSFNPLKVIQYILYNSLIFTHFVLILRS